MLLLASQNGIPDPLCLLGALVCSYCVGMYLPSFQLHRDVEVVLLASTLTCGVQGFRVQGLRLGAQARTQGHRRIGADFARFRAHVVPSGGHACSNIDLLSCHARKCMRGQTCIRVALLRLCTRTYINVCIPSAHVHQGFVDCLYYH